MLHRACTRTLVLVSALLVPVAARAQEDTPTLATFRASVDYVSLTAVVRDGRGRPVASLTRDDFELVDGGQPRPIVDLRSERSAPASLGLLVDGSGSMRLEAATTGSVAICEAILQSLDPTRDDAALFSFDTRLITLQDFTRDLRRVRGRLDDVLAFGSTSLFDAIGGTAGVVAQRSRNRRAVVVITDGADNASRYTSAEVSAIATSIDVPVYVFAVGAAARLAGDSALAELARRTGGNFFAAGDAEGIAAGVRSLVDDLRHQYVLAFESASGGGWRHVELKARRRGLRVRTRSAYIAGRAGE